MDKTQKIKADLEAYRASKASTSPVGGTSNTNQSIQSTGDIKADLEAYRASRKQSVTPTEIPEKKDGFLKTVAKDVLGTLLVKPAARATEAITRLVAPNSLATKGYEAMADAGESQDFGGIKVEQQKAFGQGGERQIAGDTLKVGSYLFPYGKVAGAVGGKLLGSATKLTPSAIKLSKLGGNVASGATGGYMSDVGYNLADENKTLGEAFTPGLGTVLGTTIPLASTGLGATRTALKSTKTATDVTKRVIQGQTKDIPLAETAFKNINTKGVKTRQELSQRLSDAMKNQMDIVDKELSKDLKPISLKNYIIKVKNNAGQEVKTDVISKSLKHLEDFFKNAGDDLSASNIGLIKKKAMREGLTRQEVNNIARMYSEEFGSKAFNKIGDPLTSVNAQMFENVRNGLKQVARGGLGGAEAKQADRLYSAMANTKRLIDKGVEGVSQLEGKLKDRNILQKLSYGAVKVLNAITGGALKSGIEALGISNVGNKIDNWVNLEQSLAKDLQFIQKANGIKSESALIKFIEDYARKFKFPGDSLIDDLNARVKGQSKYAATQRINNNTKNIIPKTSNMHTSIPQSTQKIKPSLNLEREVGSEDIRKVMEGLSLGYSKNNVIKIMEELFANNPTGKFTRQEVSQIARKYKSKVPTLKLTKK